MQLGRCCSRCATFYPPHLVESAFRTGRWQDASRHQVSRRTRWTCRPCEQTARDTKKVDNRWSVKARDTIRRHAERLPNVTKQDLIGRYGWDVERLAHDAEHQYSNGCNYCGHAYATMGHGLADITLDVVDRDKPPYYRTNTKWCCQTCNRKKGVTTPEAFENNRQVYEEWNRQQGRLRDDPQAGGFLF